MNGSCKIGDTITFRAKIIGLSENENGVCYLGEDSMHPSDLRIILNSQGGNMYEGNWDASIAKHWYTKASASTDRGDASWLSAEFDCTE